MIKKAFTIIVVILPIIGVYKSPVSSLDLGTFLLIILMAIIVYSILPDKSIKIRVPTSMLILIIYVFLGSLISYIFRIPANIILVASRWGKFIVVLSIVFVVGKEQYFDYKLAIQVLRVITLAAVTYIIFQTAVFYATGILVPNAPISLIRAEDYGNVDYIKAAKNFYRPTSFFLEPAHFSQYVFVYLVYSLFGDGKADKNALKIAAFITVGIFLSTSGQGILLCFLMWGLWFGRQFVLANIFGKYTIAVLFVLVCTVVVPIVLQTEIVKSSMERVFDSSGSLGEASLARLNSYDYFMKLPVLQKILGTGYGNVPYRVYFNSVAYTLYCNGILGMAIVLFLFLDAFLHTRHYQRYICIAYAVIIIGSTTFTASNIAFYFTMIYSGYAGKRKAERLRV